MQLQKVISTKSQFNKLFWIKKSVNFESIEGFDFCFRHYKNHSVNKKVNKYDTECLKQSEQPEDTSNEINILSEQNFLYHDLMKKKDFLNGIDEDKEGLFLNSEFNNKLS